MSELGPTLEARQQAFVRVCFDQTPSEHDLQTLGAMKDRWVLYRSMVRSRLARMVESGLRRSVAAMGKERFEELISSWFDQTPPQTRYIREVVPPFAELAIAACDNIASPPHLADLIRFETLRWEAGYDVRSVQLEAAPFDFDTPALCNPTLRLLKAGFPVHEVPMPEGERSPSEKQTAPGTLEAKPTCYAIYRRRDDRVMSRILSERAHDWLAGLTASSAPVTECIRKVAEARGETIDEPYIEALGATLATLLEQDVVLGSKAPA